METIVSRESKESLSLIKSTLEKMVMQQKGDRAIDLRLDSCGRLNIWIFYGDNLESWLFEAERCLNMNRGLPKREKVEAAITCFLGEAWAWFQEKDDRGQIQTWKELKALMLDQFHVKQTFDGKFLDRKQGDDLNWETAREEQRRKLHVSIAIIGGGEIPSHEGDLHGS
ncbi:uncharacterized protein LOC111369520 isoform X2 [Olea europaea var. sylvestris]|nr:uncharacterized protein LOC111369520 isoform X2 [Olea europaea var. sylvestris]XP_022846841.1 uncharacterized protein LOC111369520 isoform X2 [Olea europaea var. sylvestris]XP_022846842.1 uncharacterized protein LOC111369520 isoform X2 [Olea europaea var. sylvestris]XP_022846843.1 uncharacterized protein LOC111369520 isoform X2 [Olea europaea var. sylvestris]